MIVRSIFFGALFGFVLARSGASDAAAIQGMFQFRDLHLFGVIGVAIAASALGFILLRRLYPETRTGAPLALEKKPMKPGLVVGAVAFGVGWALAGACPGTALVQIGQGSLPAIVTFAGLVLGAWAERLLGRDGLVCAAASLAGPAAPASAREASASKAAR